MVCWNTEWNNKFILSKIRSQSSFESALKEAQDLGLAEADPTMDVDGMMLLKAILSALAFNTPHNFELVSLGIESVSQEDISYAADLGYSIKHIAYGSIEANEVFVSAYPTLVPNDQLLPQVGMQMNALEVNCDGLGSTVYYGPGAGPKPTASAVIADIVDISNGGWPVSKNFASKNLLSKESRQGFSRYFNLTIK